MKKQTPTTRITIALHQEYIDRLRVLGEANNISHAKLITCLLALSDDEIAKIVVEKSEELFVSKAKQEQEKKEKIRAAKKALSGLSDEEIERILSLVAEKNDAE